MRYREAKIDLLQKWTQKNLMVYGSENYWLHSLTPTSVSLFVTIFVTLCPSSRVTYILNCPEPKFPNCQKFVGKPDFNSFVDCYHFILPQDTRKLLVTKGLNNQYSTKTTIKCSKIHTFVQNKRT